MENSTNKALKKLWAKYGEFLDPFLILGILVLLIIPTMTVLNLSPTHQKQPKQTNVLGVADQEVVSIMPNLESADGVTVDKLNQIGDGVYTMYVQVASHDKGTYVNEIFTVTNGTKDVKRVQVTPSFEGTPVGTRIAVSVNDVNFVILGEDGTTYPSTISVVPGGTTVVSLVVDSSEDVNYDHGVELGLGVE